MPRRSGEPRSVVNVSYRALVDLFYPTDPDTLQALRDGTHVPLRARRMKHVGVGEVVSDIPTESIAGLLAKGRIEEVHE